MTSTSNMLLMLLLVASACVLQIEGKTIFRRTDKISENFKQLDLPPEEIDPNVAPPESEPPKVEDLADAVSPASVIDESVNEIASGDVETPNAVASVPEVAVPEAAVAEAAAAPAVATTLAAKPTTAPTTTAQPENPISKFCKCTETHCDCCRKFGLPLLSTRPGCAKIAFLGNDEMNVSLKYGDITLASRRISTKRSRPICVGLPGGDTEFCGKVYGLSRSKDSKDFKACLAFELRADEEVEASLRVSCFKFGPEGLRVAEAEPFPAGSDDDDDDDDDIFGFAAGGDDDEEDEEDYDSDADADTDDDDDTEDYADDDEAEAPEDADYGGFSLAGLLDELDDDEDEKPAKKPAVTAAVDQTREHVSADDQTTSTTDQVQSKDDSGAAVGETAVAAAAAAPIEGEVIAAVTPAPAAAVDDSTTPKSKKSKKTKKNKKKKAAAEATDETGFAYELLNGILDFFN
ncbi:uncharacterized protein LOC108110392 [Drosophila eugracilis]|uniref:uncharacterized protein LOC108110392 n=1 Tax=Drosophila eugracilis TaxID=29029 RepID=UPI0007E7BB0F|nr:uncharacterized protein LOC108110392 [Drosophila eugracilis]